MSQQEQEQQGFSVTTCTLPTDHKRRWLYHYSWENRSCSEISEER